MKKIIIFGSVVAILIVIFAYLSLSVSKFSIDEKNKKLTEILGRKPNINGSDSQTGDTIFNGKFVSFIYPKSAKIYTQRLNGKPIVQTDLEDFSFDIKDPRIIFVMSIASVPNTVQSVSDFPGVKLRKIESGTYKESSISADNISGLKYVKSDSLGIEITSFFYQKGTVYSFSAQGNDIKAVNSIFNKIISSLKFKT